MKDVDIPRPTFPDDLFERVSSTGALRRAWREIRRKKSSPGIDRVTVEQYDADANARLKALRASLRSGQWKPKPGMRIKLANDPDRKIVVPTIEARIVQRAIARTMGPFYEQTFSDASHAYRPGRSVRTALARVEHHLAAGRRCFARTDIKSFFDTVDRDRLLDELRADGVPRELMKLIEALLRAGAVEGVSIAETGGLPQGSSLSPLLSNVYLRELDARVIEAGYPYLRYADDILVLGETPDQIHDALDMLATHLEGLGLRLNLRKTFEGHVRDGVDYLGRRFDEDGAHISRSAHRALNERADELARQGHFEPISALLEEWESWYGHIKMVDIDAIGTLAGALTRALDGRGEFSVADLARRRLSLFEKDRLSAEAHVTLVETWVYADPPRPGVSPSDHSMLKAALIDTHAALAEGAHVELVERLEDVLMLPVRALGNVEGLDELIQVAVRDGITGLSEAARALNKHAPQEAEEVTRDFTLRDLDNSGQLERWLELFSTNEHSHCVEKQRSNGHYGFESTRRALTAVGMRDHLAGGTRRAIHIVGEHERVAIAALHVFIARDVVKARWGLGKAPRNASWHEWMKRVELHTEALSRSGQRLGLPSLHEKTGAHGHRLWYFFEEPIHLRHARKLMAKILARAGEPPEGINQIQIPSVSYLRKGAGPYVPLPYGLDPRTGERSVILDDEGRVVDTLSRALHLIKRISREELSSLVYTGPLHESTQEETMQQVLAKMKDWPAARQVLNQCGVLRMLAYKAHRLGHLEAEERATLYETLAYLPEPERVASLRHILGPCGRGNRTKIQRRLERLGEFPISCKKVKQRHATLADEAPCNCTFQNLWGGVYPTPILHGVAIRDIPGFVARRKSNRSKRKKKKQRHETPPPSKKAKHVNSSKRGVETSSKPATPESTAKKAPEASSTPPAPSPSDTVNEKHESARSPAPHPNQEGDVRERVAALLERMVETKSRARDVAREVRAVERELDTIFDGLGSDRLWLPVGCLVRRPGETPRFVIEV